MGIEHALIPEQGLAVPGDVIIGADSHTCTYGALGAFSTGIGSTDMAAAMATGKPGLKCLGQLSLPSPADRENGSWQGYYPPYYRDDRRGWRLYRSMEFVGDGIAHLSMDSRFTMANMAIEAGAKNGIFLVDDQTLAYVKEHSTKPYTVYEPDPDAEYEAEYTIDLSKIRPTVAFPHLPENTRTIDEVGSIKIDQVVIGSCTNGRIEDIRVAASILKGRKVANGVRVIVFPATQKIYLQALREGLIEQLIEAGAVVSTPTCGPCLGGHMGILASGERAVATTNRNFVGRMGHPESEVYLASPAVAAASALTGRISNPEDIAD